VITGNSDDSSASRPLPSKPIKKIPDPTQSDPDESEISLWPALRKPPPHAERERKMPKPKDPEEPAEPKEESKVPIESSEPRRSKKARDQPKDQEPKDAAKDEPKHPIESSGPRRPKDVPKDEPKEPIESSEPRRPKKTRNEPKEGEPKEVPKDEPKELAESSEPRRPKKARDQPKDQEPKEEPKQPMASSEPRKPKKTRNQPKKEEPKEPEGTPLCDRRDCCMQQPCVKNGEKEQDQPTLTKNPSGTRGKKDKKKSRTNIVLTDETSTTNNSNVEDSLYVLKRIHKKLDSSNSLRLKNNPDKEKVKTQLEKIIKAIEGKLANGTKLSSGDVDRMRRIVAKTAELRGAVSLTTTVTITESVSVEDEDTN
ncbi:hypothetical protein PMAYCL1PPCAC_01431, partial [Pristionchus mayeri]